MNRFCVIVLLLVLFCGNASGQRVISGQVRCNCCNAPVQYAVIQARGADIRIERARTLADSNGNYRIAIDSLHTVLEFSYFGLDNEEIIIGNDSIINTTVNLFRTGFALNAYVQNGQLVRVQEAWDRRLSRSLREHLSENLNFPETAIRQGIQGGIIVNFEIDEGRNITNVEIRRGADPLLDNEVLSVFRTAPQQSELEADRFVFYEYVWLNASRADGVRRFGMPINFIITEIEQEKL